MNNNIFYTGLNTLNIGNYIKNLFAIFLFIVYRNACQNRNC
jgi:hypothetical protein